jgi:SAM-dependent methyltransferase
MDKNEFDKLNDKYLVNEETLLYGITPRLGSHIAERFKNLTVLETCGGAGFLTIELARIANKVITVDINQEHQTQAKHNIVSAGIGKNVLFITGNILNEDVLMIANDFDAAILDPVWNDRIISNMSPPADHLFQLIYKRTKNIALILPPETEAFLGQFPSHELEKLYLDGELSLLCLYFGNLAKSKISKFEA